MQALSVGPFAIRSRRAPRDGAQIVEPPCNGGVEPAFALHVRGDGQEQGSDGLVRGVGAPHQHIDRLVDAPARLQQMVDTAFCVPAGQVRMVTAPGPVRHAELLLSLGL